MTAARSLSPGGALLRTSRFFSLPPPIAPPPGELGDGTLTTPDSATLPFPTHQAITTPNSSRRRGDWGFKRPFPLKSTTKSSTAMISVKQVDSIEHITDFASAANYGLSLRKFQELNIPVTMPTQERLNLTQGRSVFEEDGDFTAVNPGQERQALDKRWKFKGPWLAGMSPGDFQSWLSKKIRHRRLEFREFLKGKLAAEATKRKQADAADEGGFDLAAVEPVDPNTITEDELTEFTRALRADRQQLYELVSEFLDLAPLQPPSVAESLGSLVNYGSVKLKLSDSPYAEKGPPVSHPSAGISYLRTGAYLDNHPIYGPQANHAPTDARVIRPQSTAMGLTPAVLGVGGFIPSTTGDYGLNSRDARDENLRRFNPEIKGGAKVSIQATKATVDSRGRLILGVRQAAMEDACIAKELVGKDKVFGQSRSFNETATQKNAAFPGTLGRFSYGRSGPRGGYAKAGFKA